MLPFSTFTDHAFQLELAALLSKLDSEIINEMMLQSRKAGSNMAEMRDTASPGLVTEMLMSMLASLGRPAEVNQIQKRVRDDVLWDDSLQPWRRSAFWLTLRVAIQTTLVRSLPVQVATCEFKNFIAFLMAEIASQALSCPLSYDLTHVVLTKVARKIYKLGSTAFAFVQQRALEVGKDIQSVTMGKWQDLQAEDLCRQTTVGMRSFSGDTSLSLDNSKAYIYSVLVHSQDEGAELNQFAPRSPQWLEFSGSLPCLDSLQGSPDELVFGLAEIENWIKDHLSIWVEEHSTTPRSDDCVKLSDLAIIFFQKASKWQFCFIYPTQESRLFDRNAYIVPITWMLFLNFILQAFRFQASEC